MVLLNSPRGRPHPPKAIPLARLWLAALVILVLRDCSCVAAAPLPLSRALRIHRPSRTLRPSTEHSSGLVRRAMDPGSAVEGVAAVVENGFKANGGLHTIVENGAVPLFETGAKPITRAASYPGLKIKSSNAIDEVAARKGWSSDDSRLDKGKRPASETVESISRSRTRIYGKATPVSSQALTDRLNEVARSQALDHAPSTSAASSQVLAHTLEEASLSQAARHAPSTSSEIVSAETQQQPYIFNAGRGSSGTSTTAAPSAIHGLSRFGPGGEGWATHPYGWDPKTTIVPQQHIQQGLFSAHNLVAPPGAASGTGSPRMVPVAWAPEHTAYVQLQPGTVPAHMGHSAPGTPIQFKQFDPKAEGAAAEMQAAKAADQTKVVKQGPRLLTTGAVSGMATLAATTPLMVTMGQQNKHLAEQNAKVDQVLEMMRDRQAATHHPRPPSIVVPPGPLPGEGDS